MNAKEYRAYWNSREVAVFPRDEINPERGMVVSRETGVILSGGYIPRATAEAEADRLDAAYKAIDPRRAA